MMKHKTVKTNLILKCYFSRINLSKINIFKTYLVSQNKPNFKSVHSRNNLSKLKDGA